MKVTCICILTFFLLGSSKPQIFYYNFNFSDIYVVRNGDSTKIKNVKTKVLEEKGGDVLLYTENQHEFRVKIEFDYELGEYMKVHFSNYVIRPNGSIIKGRNVKISKAHRLGIPCKITGRGFYNIPKIKGSKKDDAQLHYTVTVPY